MNNLKCTVLALTMGASLFISGKAFSQVPSYLPTNGLVGWWPFNGNANDESGNGNNGTVIGGQFQFDRFLNANSAYYGNGINSGIDITNLNNFPFGDQFRTISVWFKCELPYPGGDRHFFAYGDNTFGTRFSLYTTGSLIGVEYCNGAVRSFFEPDSLWHQIIVTYNGAGSSGIQIFVDGQLTITNVLAPISSLNTANSFVHTIGSLFNSNFFKGMLDDIGIWNRALTQQEISDIYVLQTCSNDLTISPPSNNLLNIGGNASFTAITTDANPTFTWQSDFGQGFQNLNDYGNYTGTNTNALNISNVQLANHNQPIRAISTSGNCTDTSNTVTIQIADTCITTISDTLYTTVTDTLIINTTLSLPAPNNENTILIYPNPASDHITIDNGNYTAMAGYTIKIENNAGQQVFQSLINQAQFYVDLSTWTGNGLYFVHFIDPQNNTVTVRKIVLQ